LNLIGMIDLLGNKIKMPSQICIYSQEIKMENQKTKMFSGHWTWLKLQPESKFNPFFEELKDHLRSKLQIIQNNGHSYYSCGTDYHHRSISTWKPFRHFEKYCQLMGYDDMVAKEMIEEKLGRKIICECELVNDAEADRRVRLQRSFGIDLGEPEH
jgi:hypothetical protein